MNSAIMATILWRKDKVNSVKMQFFSKKLYKAVSGMCRNKNGAVEGNPQRHRVERRSANNYLFGLAALSADVESG